MNSNSTYYDDNYSPCKKDRKEPDYGKKEKKPICPTIIKCSCPGSVTIPVIVDAGIGTTFTATSLTLDTSCLKNPCTKLEFTSNLVSTAFTGTLSFQVFKQCKYQFAPVPVGPAFIYSRAVGVAEANTFSFFVCDCDSCNDDCCTYTLVVTAQTAIGVGLAISNATLGAISTCGSNSCAC